MDFKLPELGEGVSEGELIQWLVKEGDTVSSDQALLEVMTDKATVEVPSPASGKISSLKAQPGEMIQVGAVLAEIAADAGAGTDTAKKADEKPEKNTAEEKEKPKAAAEAQQATHREAPKEAPNDAPKEAPTSKQKESAPTAAPAPYRSAIEQHGPDNIVAAPIVRSMASRSGVDLGQVQGTGSKVGEQARILEEDLLRFLEGQTSTAQAPKAAPSNGAGTAASTSAAATTKAAITQPQIEPGQGERREPVRGLRRVIAQAMVRSKYTAPHYSYVDEFNCEAFVELRNEAKKIAEKQGIKLTYLPFIVKAVVAALKEFPIVNSSLEEKDDGSMEIVYKDRYDIGFAVATKDGLIVPVIRDADKKSILSIATEMAELSDLVRAGKAPADKLKNSTFTITSMGNIGGLFATPIINYPEVGILGVYKIQDKPVVKNGEIVAGKTMHISLSLDHRVVDGAVGGYFSNAIIARLEHPARLLLDMGL